jgi:hypothetical protein
MQGVYQRVFGHNLPELSPPQALERLKTGKKEVICCLFWDARLPEHQLVLRKIAPDNRVVFYNPYKERHGIPVGTVLSDPERRVEEGGLESVSFDVFRTFFTQRNAICFGTEKAGG